MCAFLVAAGATQASPQSEQLTREGLVKLQARDFVEAARLFERAYRADPRDGKAAFYFGVALNRLGQHGAALGAFQRMWDLGLDHAGLGFEGGWAALGRRQFRTAVTLLEPYVKKNPDNAKAHEFLGRAYIGVGRLDEAEAELNKAQELDPRLRPTVLLALANIADLRGDRARADALLNETLREAPESPVGRTLRGLAQQVASQPGRPAKPWFITFALSTGHNDNVIGLADGAALPSDITSQRSGFHRAEIAGGYNWRIDRMSQAGLGYNMSADWYDKVDNFDSQVHGFHVDYSRRVAQDVIASLRLFGGFSVVDDDVAVWHRGLQPSVSYRWDRNNFTDLSWSYSRSYYENEPLTRFIDRDARTQVLTLAHRTRIDSETLPLDLGVRAGLFYIRNSAEGADYEYDGHGAFVTLARELFGGINGTLTISRQADKYNNANSLAGTGFAFAREDTITRYSVVLSRPLPLPDEVGGGQVTLFARYNHTDNNSNVSFFNYDQTVVDFGVSARF